MLAAARKRTSAVRWPAVMRGAAPGGALQNVATGLIVSPNGTGAQLRGTTAPVPWGGSACTWTDYAHLPW